MTSEYSSFNALDGKTNTVTLPNKKVYETKNPFSYGAAMDLIKSGDFGMRLNSWKADVVIFSIHPSDEDANPRDMEVSAPFVAVCSRFGVVPWGDTQIEKFASWEVLDLEAYRKARFD